MRHRRLAKFATFAMSIAFAAQGLAADEPRPGPYSGMKLIVAEPASARHLNLLSQLGENLACNPGPGPQRYVVPADAIPVLDEAGLQYQVVAEDVQTLVDEETRMREQARAERGPDFFADYRTPTEIYAYLDTLITLQPNVISKESIGLTIEGRTMWAYRIKAPGPLDTSKPALFINGAQHAREWISPAATVWAMDRLVRNYGVLPDVTALLDQVNWYFVPIANPDGYQYTFPVAQGGAGQRLWRKNRRNNGDGSFGVDTNRNWSIGWGLNGGSSATPSSETYRGTAPFSEPEVVNIRDYVMNIPNLKGHVDVHSYSQLVLAPWGYTTDPPPREAEVLAVANAMEDAITATNGVTYTAGQTSIILYIASGTANDWTFGALDALGYGYELRDTGTNGFILPPAQIVPNSTEVFNGFKVLAQYIQLKAQITAPSLAAASSEQPTPFTVQVVPFNNNSIFSVTMYYRVGSSGPFTPLALTGAPPSYSGSFPAGPCGQQFEYYFHAQIGDGSIVKDPPDAPASVHALDILDISVTIDDNFETATGWTVGAPGDTATTGIWVRADPVGTPAQPEDDHTANPGVNCFVTGNGTPGGAVGANDIDGGATTLTSPNLALAGQPDATISYWRWFHNTYNGPNTQDTMVVSISPDGSTWVNVETLGPGGSGVSGGWIYKEFRVGDYIVPTNTTKMRFVPADIGTGSIVEAALDDFRVQTIEPCPPPPDCVGDLNGDNGVDSTDLNILLTDFGCVGAGCVGDADDDGDTDSTDLNILLAVFGDTCD